VNERVSDGRLSLHGAYFAIADGQLCVLDPTSGQFAPA
jgi:carbonic anhydrase